MWLLYIALNISVKLFLLISLGLLFFLGQGWLVAGPILQGSLTKKNRDIPLLQEIPLMLLSGMMISYGIIMIFRSLSTSLIVEGVLSIFGLCCYGLYAFRNRTRQRLTLASISNWIGISVVCLLVLSPILLEPLSAWDARSIWFFHAKMIYVANSIGQSAGWQHPSIVFSHADYPNLVPAIAAQVSRVVGFWNEYIPKLSLFYMFVPAVIWLFSFSRRSFSFAILLMLIPFSFYSSIWDGYMDGYLALYFSIAMLLLGRYINSSQPVDMVSSICCLISLLYIKNEGVLAAITGLCVIILVLWLKKNYYSAKKVFMENWKHYLVGLIALIPFVIWSLNKQQWGLSNDLEIGTSQSFLRIITRLTDGSYQSVFQSSYEQLEGAFLLLGLLYFVSVINRRSLTKASYPALIAAGIYCLGIIIVYLLTPRDLMWQLHTSIGRTMLAVNASIFVGCYFILNTLEKNQV